MTDNTKLALLRKLLGQAENAATVSHNFSIKSYGRAYDAGFRDGIDRALRILQPEEA